MNALYGLKFIAFLFIFFHHLAYPHSFGGIFTTFFFVFAGFIIAYSFKKKNFNPDKKSIKEFYKSKFIKNYPIYIFTFILSIPLYKDNVIFTIKDFFIHAFMLQTVIPRGNKIFLFNGLSWFLVDLLIFYLIIPYVYKLLNKMKVNTNKKYIMLLISLFLIQIGMSEIFKNCNTEIYNNYWWFLYITPLSRIFNFLIGFVFGLIFEKNQEYLKNKLLKLPKFLINILEIMALSTIIIRYNQNYYASYSLNGTFDIPMSLILISVFGLGVGFISKILGAKPLVHLGKLSLSCYMLHQLIINYLSFCCWSYPWYKQDFSYTRNMFNALFILIIIVCISEVFQKYILNPVTDFLLSFSKRKLFKNKKIANIRKKVETIFKKISEIFIRISNIVFTIIEVIFTMIILFILVSNIINKNILFNNYNYLFIFATIILYFAIIYLLYCLIKKIKVNNNKLFVIFMCIYCLLQILVIIMLKVNPSWDFGAVLNIVSDSLNGKSSISSAIYLYQFQNNVVYTYLLKVILIPFKILGMSDYLTAAMIVNALVLDIGILFIYKIMKLLFDEEKNKLFLILLFTFQPILLYVPIIYTDSFAFTFLAIILYLMLYLLISPVKKVKNNKEFKVSFALGIILGLGIQIKFTLIILLIALFIILLFKKDIMNNIKKLSLILLGFALISFIIKININENFDSELLENNQVPITHWIMMGLYNYGNYNALDYKMTFESGNYSEKIEFNKKEIIRRIKEHYYNHNLLLFYTSKSAYMWGDGMYYLPKLLCLSAKKNILHEFILVDGKYFNYYSYYSQIKHIFMIVILLLLPLISKNDKNRLLRNFLLISIIGYFSFFTIWEVSSRYLFHMIPLLFITFLYCLNIILIKIEDRKSKGSLLNSVGKK